jgi:hypothetical protein
VILAELIYDALRIGGVLNAGETQNTDESAEALRALNGMVEAWATDRAKVYAIRIDEFALTAAQSYTVGAGGNFNMPRPERIESANIILMNEPLRPLRKPLTILRDSDEWAAIKIQNYNTPIPLKMYYDNAYPLGKAYFWPIPDGSNRVEFYSWLMVTGFLALGDVVRLPPGYGEALTYNLALRLAGRHGRKLSPVDAAIAAQSLAAIQSINLPKPLMTPDASGLATIKTGFNWLTGE